MAGALDGLRIELLHEDHSEIGSLSFKVLPDFLDLDRRWISTGTTPATMSSQHAEIGLRRPLQAHKVGSIVPYDTAAESSKEGVIVVRAAGHAEFPQRVQRTENRTPVRPLQAISQAFWLPFALNLPAEFVNLDPEFFSKEFGEGSMG